MLALVGVPIEILGGSGGLPPPLDLLCRAIDTELEWTPLHRLQRECWLTLLRCGLCHYKHYLLQCIQRSISSQQTIKMIPNDKFPLILFVVFIMLLQFDGFLFTCASVFTLTLRLQAIVYTFALTFTVGILRNKQTLPHTQSQTLFLNIYPPFYSHNFNSSHPNMYHKL